MIPDPQEIYFFKVILKSYQVFNICKISLYMDFPGGNEW